MKGLAKEWGWMLEGRRKTSAFEMGFSFLHFFTLIVAPIFWQYRENYILNSSSETTVIPFSLKSFAVIPIPSVTFPEKLPS